MNILKAPILENSNSFIKNKFNLTWYTFVVYFFILLILTSVHYNQSQENFLVSLAGLTYCVGSIIYLYLKKEHLLISKFSTIVISLIVQYTLYNLINPDRSVDVIWFLIIGLFTFYTVNVKWGVSILLVNFFALAVHQPILSTFYNVKTFSTPLMELSTADRLDYFINFGFGVVFIAFLTIKLINEHKYVTNELELKNKIVNDQNNEKTILLKEIHHRVKNNLQIISSLLRLQSNDITDKKTIDQFEEATNRVVAMSLIHDRMYQSDNLSKIDLKEYIITLSSELISCYSTDTPVDITINSELKLITPKFLVSFALIFNELITNSLKHGFRNHLNGEIEITITKTDQKLQIIYFDNGNWITAVNTKSFGLELINTLTEQLDGKYERDHSVGTLYNFEIPFNSENIN